MRIEVYRNLHKKCLSVRDIELGRVTAHPYRVLLHDAKMVVQPAGRRKVLEQKRKNVHAFVRGTWAAYNAFAEGDETKLRADGFRLATYNPYKYATFVDVETEQPVLAADYVVVDESKVWYFNE